MRQNAQAGDKVKAMKALLRGGDAEKIIFFAGESAYLLIVHSL